MSQELGARLAPSPRESMDPSARSRALLVAYGNLSRRDDGVAGHIVSRLRRRLGLAELELENDVRVSEDGEVITEDGPEGYPRMQMILLHQLAPELGETLASFDLVVFLDAHVQGATTPEGDLWEDVHLQRIDAGLQTSMVTHHLKPAAVLALSRTLYGSEPEAYVLSVLGHDFNFGETLSDATSRLADEAVERLDAVLRRAGL